MTILVTGGAGYIGSHTCVSLLKAGHDVVVIDNFGNSYPEVLHRVEKIAGRPLINAPGDIRDREFVETVLKRYRCSSVIHFAGLKAVGESAARPLFYYDCNVVGTLRLLQAMRALALKNLFFRQRPRFTEHRTICPMMKNTPVCRKVSMVRQSLLWKKCLQRYAWPIRSGALLFCAISILSVPMKAA